jgi:hypothetical protein
LLIDIFNNKIEKHAVIYSCSDERVENDFRQAVDSAGVSSGFFPKDFLQLFKAQARASTQISLDVKEL